MKVGARSDVRESVERDPAGRGGAGLTCAGSSSPPLSRGRFKVGGSGSEAELPAVRRLSFSRDITGLDGAGTPGACRELESFPL